MKVQEVMVNGNLKYMLIDNNESPVFTVTKYLKYLDNTGKSNNTLKVDPELSKL